MAAKMLGFHWLDGITHPQQESLKGLSEKLLYAVEKHAQFSEGDTLQFIVGSYWDPDHDPLSYQLQAQKIDQDNKLISISAQNHIFSDGRIVTKNEAFQGPDAIEKAAKEIAAELNIGAAPL